MRATHFGKGLRRAMLAALGTLCVAMAIVGIFVPGLPTTVFVLAASYLFARSSPRLDRWLAENPWLGPSLRRFAETGGMSMRSKAVALFWMWAGVSLSWVALSGELVAQVSTAGLGLVGTGTLLWLVRTTPVPRLSRQAIAVRAGSER